MSSRAVYWQESGDTIRITIQYIAIHCDTVSKAIYWDISYFRNRIYF